MKGVLNFAEKCKVLLDKEFYKLDIIIKHSLHVIFLQCLKTVFGMFVQQACKARKIINWASYPPIQFKTITELNYKSGSSNSTIIMVAMVMVVILVTIIIFSISLPVPFKEKFSVWILLIFRNLEMQVCPPTVDEPFSNRQQPCIWKNSAGIRTELLDNLWVHMRQ